MEGVEGGEAERWREVAVAAARQAGAIIATAFRKTDGPENIERKTVLDVVTETDKECERVIMEALLGAFPTHRFIGEETAFPYICVCIGLVVNKKPLVGVVYAPLLDEMFTAISGQGAFLMTDQFVCRRSELESAMLATGFPKYREYLNFQTAAIYQALANGSCALDMCGVAVGRLEAYYTCTGVRTWDFAAATVIVREAGGLVLDPTGGELDIMGKRVMATNGQEMADKIVGFIRDRNLPQDVGSLPDF
ncbi:myoinositol monophosphatase 1, putative [Acanthamoeba castellanii str. Neff]|uniref:Inositol-1-monophosphatase n=1 Tax=Acanthamoeba castellanii (strain ATCC 30010 / Neff) TaxID=1257118 RepID=L8HEC3_ACACF|nr:myoinositol monophosphatase 1, putative [Acanthamoeba castellanii str. Neff]ELR22751.1 myoinositol monophosphatase 1, putative [Acanthamoeba castellanii str. Neff]